MGKKNKHSKDKLFKTVTELVSHHVDHTRDLELSALNRRLKFDSCCLSLNTITGKPVGLCDSQGYCYIFECDVIVKFLEKYKIHPITGSSVNVSDLIELKFHKSTENQYHCPIIYKLFNQNSKIVANKKTGHVYSYEAYQQLNLKPNNLRDLLTDEPFEKSDIVVIQDPDTANEKWKVTNFHYIKSKLKIDDETCESNIRNVEESSILKASLDEYKSKSKAIVETFNRIVGQSNDEDDVGKTKLDAINGATHSDGLLSSSVTSTYMPAVNVQNPALLSHEQILYPRIKKKGYVELVTNFGSINLELYCDRTPKTCHNFLLLVTKGYYDGTIFHRLIKNFILQGGDPTGTGSGGQSAWIEPFEDECRADLKHVGRGVVAMANSGPATNKSQFYITLRGTWDHLDGKHTVFGRVVGGDETLNRIETVEVDKKDVPTKEIKILKAVVYFDPFEEIENAIKESRKKENEANKRKDKSNVEDLPEKRFRVGVGTYINLDSLQNAKSDINENSDSDEIVNVSPSPADVKKTDGHDRISLASKLASVVSKKKSASNFGDFSNW